MRMDSFVPLLIGTVGTVFIASVITWALFFRRSRAPALTRDWQSFRVSGRIVANPESDRLVVFLTLHVSTLELPTGSHVKLRMLKPDGKEIVRSYTPTRFNRGECEIMFRVYPQGVMTPLLEKLRIGDHVDMMGPTGLERYGVEGAGTFSRGSGKVWRGIKHVGMISGGTGITPMLQISNHVLQDKSDSTQLSLLSFTNTVDDIMLGDTLRSLSKDSMSSFKLTFVASHASDDELSIHSDVVRGSMRSMSIVELSKLLSVPSGPETMICICGPDGFVKTAQKLLEGKFENILVW